jgi:hypothetical protein
MSVIYIDYESSCTLTKHKISPAGNTHIDSVDTSFYEKKYNTSHLYWRNIQDDSKLLSEFPFIDHGNSDTNLESARIYLYLYTVLLDHFGQKYCNKVKCRVWMPFENTGVRGMSERKKEIK